MRAIVIREHGDVDRLRLEDRPVPDPGPCQVRVKVAAVGINHLDLWVRRGIPGVPFPLPIVPGSDIAGTVDALGPGARGWSEGDRVVVGPGYSCGSCLPCRSGNDPLCREYGILGESRDGGCVDYLVARDTDLFPMPGGLSFVEAATIPLVFLTAWHMLVARAAVRPGEAVLIHAAGSGVSSAAIQIARLWGARVLATAGTDAKCDHARRLGAEEAVNYADGDFVREVRRWTGKRGVDVAVDHVGADTFQRTLKCLAKGGRYVTCGATSGPEMQTDFRLVFFKGLSILGSTMGAAHELATVLGHVASGALKPVVDRVLPLERVGEAHRHLESRSALGKTVLEL
jgi:NADPH:quinone reductase-like Zn-dependent oxidoreductase